MATMQLLLCASIAALAAAGCPEGEFIVGDMHDGDYKLVTIKGEALTIKPHANNQTWVITSKYDLKTCSAPIDFNVPGKPSPPPKSAKLVATAFRLINGDNVHVAFEFTDLSGVIVKNPHTPINEWVQLPTKTVTRGASQCPEGEFIVGDMGDGDQKLVTIKGEALTIVPHGNNESWVIKTKYDLKACSAMIDFHVPGKPSPPPAGVVLLATAFRMVTAYAQNQHMTFEFVDPKGTIAKKGEPINEWVQMPKKN